MENKEPVIGGAEVPINIKEDKIDVRAGIIRVGVSEGEGGRACYRDRILPDSDWVSAI